MLLVNLETFETMEADECRLQELGLPEDFVVAEAVLVECWIEAGQFALARGFVRMD